MYIEQVYMCTAVNKPLMNKGFCREEKHFSVCDALVLVLVLPLLATHVCF